ncbi:iron chelate uptake ABC transporter family permease subunit [Leucobacter weissii]|uniref:Iron chelate uptake ABC transporter family permease subunit n=1 Tax=Leucobacter weissii TaxID=1983706 RepID=A0A939MJV2_9MICO|nr:iron chelate uptake ABC transporter family permease subunit [Leucobacter weissii]MBO1901565.1 iron chelate uptake ABC transporter family permease subunit [Leucobacter weissii]
MTGSTAPVSAAGTSAVPETSGAARRDPGTGFARPGAVRASAIVLSLLLLGVAILLSLSFGSKHIPLGETWSLLLHPDDTAESLVLHELRLPRTLLAIVVGAALGIAGGLMQSLTRNPLADPGVLGINAGASLAVVLAVALTGVSGIGFYLWFAFAGAALASAGVYALGSSGRNAATPVRLALAGVAISAALQALTNTVILGDQVAYNEFRYWVSGSLEGRLIPILLVILPFVIVGVLLALLLAPALNALALGVDTGRSLGVRVTRTRVGAMVAITLLCGAATAAVGPIGFVGLAVPFASRLLVGSDQRWVTITSAILGPAWLLIADVLARVVVAPEEVPAGVIAALLGAPVFIAIVRSRRLAAL